MTDSTFWTAVGAIAASLQTLIVLGSAITIWHQLRQFRRQSIESRIAGLRTALDVLNVEEFRKVSNAVMQRTKVGSVQSWNALFEIIDQVALLISENYTDEKLLLKLKGHELSTIGRYVVENEIPEESRQLLNSAKYEAVRDLLNKSVKYVSSL